VTVCTRNELRFTQVFLVSSFQAEWVILVHTGRHGNTGAILPTLSLTSGQEFWPTLHLPLPLVE